MQKWKKAAGVGAVAAAGTWYFASGTRQPEGVVDYTLNVASRPEQVARLSEGTKSNPFDVLIIGGGATGTGCALDAATRGLKTALIEGEDFGAGTSSRSTKLVHGGLRYLEKAVFNLDLGQLYLVFEALSERKTLLNNAPHLTSSLPIMMVGGMGVSALLFVNTGVLNVGLLRQPCYKWWEVPFYWAGLKAYDLVAGVKRLTMSRFVSANESRRQFPTLSPTRSDGSSLQGTILYYDGQFNDSRLNVSLACTAALAGAAVANHVECASLIKEDNLVVGARVIDKITRKKIDVYAKTIVNAAGPFVDSVRKMADASAKDMILPSAGVHITLPDYYSPDNIGMIIPKTEDGRVVFMLPWLDHTIAGTTDSNSEISMLPKPSESEVQFILNAISDYLTVQVRTSDVLAAWSGIRPLAVDPATTSDTATASRDHVVAVEGNMVTVAGGKWTTYRKMAIDAIDAAVKTGGLRPVRPSCTEKLLLIGGPAYTPVTHTEVAQNYVVPHRPGAIDTRVAKYLAQSYGDRAGLITRIAEERKLGKRLVRGHPVIEAEVVYCVHNEYCRTVVDFIARRTRLAFLDAAAASEAIVQVANLMAAELNYGGRWKKAQIREAQAFLKTFHNPLPPKSK